MKITRGSRETAHIEPYIEVDLDVGTLPFEWCWEFSVWEDCEEVEGGIWHHCYKLDGGCFGFWRAMNKIEDTLDYLEDMLIEKKTVCTKK